MNRCHRLAVLVTRETTELCRLLRHDHDIKEYLASQAVGVMFKRPMMRKSRSAHRNRQWAFQDDFRQASKLRFLVMSCVPASKLGTHTY
ncbi:hypothetical protein CY34DRAFT_388221 [Suillus luteus UH-Slu-Lm8-n1]|uniref:Uncharacterized protein n=1 Tax=Suillus luteus UH-Slu-Lm8-n1 TaxID=930992 RepID=A0A0D0AVY7_9AGAM|nr:hypothetical protein CY34DRAFT_388221 [Suillus luteus UH-Slu-Lm8-n1]